jgi:hypothetical protein
VLRIVGPYLQETLPSAPVSFPIGTLPEPAGEGEPQISGEWQNPDQVAEMRQAVPLDRQKAGRTISTGRPYNRDGNAPELVIQRGDQRVVII